MQKFTIQLYIYRKFFETFLCKNFLYKKSKLLIKQRPIKIQCFSKEIKLFKLNG